jgi:anti-anti-sigma factor
MPLGSFEVLQCADPDGALRVILVGEIDMAAAGDLRACLASVEPRGRPVRFDSSGLRFIDCCGLRTVLGEVEEARSSGWNFEVDRRVSAAVERMVGFADAAPILWPLDAAPAPEPV